MIVVSHEQDGSSSDADWHSIVMQDSSYWRAKTDETDESCSEEVRRPLNALTS